MYSQAQHSINQSMDLINANSVNNQSYSRVNHQSLDLSVAGPDMMNSSLASFDHRPDYQMSSYTPRYDTDSYNNQRLQNHPPVQNKSRRSRPQPYNPSATQVPLQAPNVPNILPSYYSGQNVQKQTSLTARNRVTMGVSPMENRQFTKSPRDVNMKQYPGLVLLLKVI